MFGSAMKCASLLVVLFAIASVVANDVGEHDSYEAYDSPEENINFQDTSVDYMTCIEEGTCIPASEEPEHSSHEDYGYHQDAQSEHHASKSYKKLCNKLGRKMHELEALHPELKDLKFELLKMLDSHSSGFNLECQKGESIIAKVLDVVIYLAEKLKADFGLRIPIEVSTSIPSEEIIAEEHDIPVQVGSVRGIPGEHYPNYSEVPITSFSCSDKKYVPGFYADLETGCQVFHVCYEHRRESFLCPVGTIFNQPILACDYWYSSNCSQAPLYYDVNEKEAEDIEVTDDVSNIGNLITTIIEGDKSKQVKQPDIAIPKGDLDDLLKFLPIKAKIVEFEKPKVISTKPMVVIPKPMVVIPKPMVVIPKPMVVIPKPMVVIPKLLPLPIFKPKLAAKLAVKVPIAKVFKAKVAIPVLKAKVAIPIVKAKVAIPIVKAKVAIPIVKAKVAIPIVKSKFVALPFMKTKYVAAKKMPLFKAKTTAKVMPFVKLTAKKSKVVAGVPIIKAKFAKYAMISPITKKALALGYLKLLKAKKLALMG